MTALRLPLASYELDSIPASSARLVNCVAEKLPEGAKTPFLLKRLPGVREFLAVGTGPIRGEHRAFGNLYVVSGTELYKVAQNGTTTNLGNVGSGAVSMAHNADTLVVVTAPDAYTSDGSTAGGVTQITDLDFTALGARWVGFLDNYLLFVAADGSRFFWSNVGSATSYDALDYAVPEGSPDDIVGFICDHRQAVFLGSESVELWETVDDGFVRTINGFMELGCVNGDTVAQVDNTVIWVASDYTVRKLDGTTPVKISSIAVDQFLATVDVTTGRAYQQSKAGHIYYVLCFSTGCKAWDATTGEWADRASHPEDFYRWQYCCDAYGTTYVGDFESNHIGTFDPTCYDEYGDVQRMEFTFQPVYAENRLAIHHSLEIVLETGVGLTVGQGSDPEIMLSYSDDGGMTYTNLPNGSIGPIGERFTRVVWSSLGASRQRVYRAAISDPVKVAVTDAILRATGARL